ncbi:translation initiation factor IF-2, partial [candidate division WWE3 bacterium]|nr:translation initiation factor IF-2 [candidate division WWE3 bacterium]
PIIVAINKIDMSNADPMMVKQQLTEHGLITEDFGGDIVTVELSAMTGQGVDQLLEMIQLVAEMEELERNADGPAKGIVLEGKQDARQGIAATLIVQNGTLKPGNVVATASTWGKIRRMTDWQGTVTKEVGPSGPVEVLGLQDVPQAGELFEVVENEKEAKDKIQELDQVAEDRSVVKDDDMKVVPLIVKADTKGALEAFLAALHSLNTDEGMVQIIHSGLSDVTEADVVLAHVSKAIVLGFNVGVDKAASSAAQMERVPVMTYDVIYRALEDVEDFLESEVDQLRAIGEASVKQVFELSDGTLVAGSVVSEGHGVTGAKVEVWRGDERIGEARVKSLRHNKDKRSKVEQGEECGIILNTRIEFEPGDTILLFPS